MRASSLGIPKALDFDRRWQRKGRVPLLRFCRCNGRPAFLCRDSADLGCEAQRLEALDRELRVRFCRQASNLADIESCRDRLALDCWRKGAGLRIWRERPNHRRRRRVDPSATLREQLETQLHRRLQRRCAAREISRVGFPSPGFLSNLTPLVPVNLGQSSAHGKPKWAGASPFVGVRGSRI